MFPAKESPEYFRISLSFYSVLIHNFRNELCYNIRNGLHAQSIPQDSLSEPRVY